VSNKVNEKLKFKPLIERNENRLRIGKDYYNNALKRRSYWDKFSIPLHPTPLQAYKTFEILHELGFIVIGKDGETYGMNFPCSSLLESESFIDS